MSGEEQRGGTAVLFRSDIWDKAYDIKRLRDQVWFRITTMKDYLFGAVYIPPRDSPYFSHDSFAIINEMACACDDSLVILGDLNARMNDLDVFCETALDISYQENCDRGSNRNGKDLIELCAVYNL